MPGPQVWVADDFRPARRTTDDDRRRRPSRRADLNTVRDGFARFDLLDDRVRFLQGHGATRWPTAPIEEIALLRIGARTGRASRRLSTRSTTRSPSGGFVVIDDYGRPDLPDRRSTTFRADAAIAEPLERVDWAARAWRKTTEPDAAGRRRPPSEGDRAAASLRRPATDGHQGPVGRRRLLQHAREAARTLHSLSRAYQQGIDDLDYEVIVVENGSTPDQRLGEEFVAQLRPRVPLHRPRRRGRRPRRCTRSTAGIAASRGRARRADDRRRPRAHPGRAALRHARARRPTRRRSSPPSSGTSARASRATPSRDGYDQALEDQLFDADRVAGRRLPAVRDRPLHRRPRLVRRHRGRATASSCPRTLLEQVGGFDESFSMPGGGYANLELLRAAWRRSPDVDRRRRSSARARSTRCTAAPPPTCAELDERARPDRVLRRALRGAARAARSAARRSRSHYVGTLPDAPGAPGPPAHERPTHVRGRRTRRHPTGARPSRCRCPRSSTPSSSTRSGAACVAADDLARATGRRTAADRPVRVPGADLRGAARLDHRDRHRRRRPGPVPRLDLRPARPRAGALDRRLPGRQTCPSTRGSPTCASPPTSARTAAEVRKIVGGQALVILGAADSAR